MSESGRLINYMHKIRGAKGVCPRCSQEVQGKINDELAIGNESKHYIESTGNIRLLSLANFALGMGKGSNAFRTGAVVDHVPHFVTPQG